MRLSESWTINISEVTGREIQAMHVNGENDPVHHSSFPHTKAPYPLFS
jgi:hypothetical protein